MKNGKFFGVSLGPGDPGLITVKALDALRSVDYIFTVVSRQSSRSVSGAIIDALDGITAERVKLVFAMRDNSADKAARIAENASLILDKLKSGYSCAFVTIGDALTYSTYGYILSVIRKHLPELDIETIPGVNSWSALSAKVNRVLVEDREELSIIPSYAEESPLSVINKTGGTAVLLKTYKTRDKLVAALDEDGCEFLYGSNLGMENEFISDNSEEILSRANEYLSMLIVKKKK